MSKHTPRPWIVCRVETTDEWGEFEVTGPDESHIADVTGGFEDCAESAANARLIAAAPTLVAALEGLMDAVPTQTNDCDWWPDELTRAMAAARKALDEAGIEP